MGRFVDSLASLIESGPPDLVPEALSQAVYVFEKYYRTGPVATTAEEAAAFGWPVELLAETITGQEVARLEGVMIRSLQRSPTGPHVGSASFALGKSRGPGNRSALIGVLKDHVNGNPEAMYQAMIALQNIEEDVFVGEHRMCSLDVENNRRHAVAYLARAESD